MSKLFRKPSFWQLLCQGPAAYIANPTARRIAIVVEIVHAGYQVYRDSKLPVVLYRTPYSSPSEVWVGFRATQGDKHDVR